MWSYWVTYLESMAFGDHVDPFSGQIPYGPSDVGASELAFYLVYITIKGVETIALSIE